MAIFVPVAKFCCPKELEFFGRERVFRRFGEKTRQLRRRLLGALALLDVDVRRASNRLATV